MTHDANRDLDRLFGGEYGESPVRFGLRDSLAHSYADELPPPRPPLVRDTWRDSVRDAVEIVAGVMVLGTLFLGIPLLLFLVAS